ncbi:MAG: hypothetical protein AB7T06_24675 [Kofleriaceae bacterium]
MTVLTKPCPRCGAELTAALADAIGNPRAPESCPTAPKVVRPGMFGGFISGLTPAGPGTFPGSPPPAGAAGAISIVADVADGLLNGVARMAGVEIDADVAGRRMASYALLGSMVDEQRERQMRQALGR